MLNDNIDVFDGGHTGRRRGTHELIAGIDDDFIKDFVEAWIEMELSPDHFVGTGIIDPSRLLIGLRAANIRVREFKDVLVLG